MNRNTPRNVLAAALVVLAAGLAPAQVSDYRKIEYPPLPKFDIPKPEIVKLDNGLQLFLLEDHELPLITIDAIVRTGSNYEPADKAGLADIFGQVLRDGGTARMSPDELDEFLANRAATIETGMGGDSGSATLDCLEEDFDDVLGVFRDILREPAFAEDKVELAEVQARTAIARRNDDVGSITSREFRRLIYGPDSALGRMMEYSTVAAITRDDLVAWHRRWYRPENVMLGVTGDFEARAMKAKIEKAFGDWKGGKAAALPAVPYREEPNPGIYFVEKSDVTQANIRIGHLGIERDNPDFYAVEVMNEVFGGGFSGRLINSIRTDKGLAYSVGGGIGSGYLRPGVFQVRMQTASKNLTTAIKAVESEIGRIISEPPSAEELKRAKEAILNSFVFNFASRRQILNQQMTFAYFGLPVNWLDSYRSNIDKVTAADVARVAKEYVHPDRLTLLVVGKSADFDAPLSTLGPVHTLDISIPPPPEAGPEVASGAESVASGRAIFARAVEKLGGAEPSSYRGFASEANMSLEVQGQTIPLKQKVVLVLPDRLRADMSGPMGNQTIVLDGDSGFVAGGGRVQDLPAPAIAEQRESLHHDLLFLVSHADSPELEIAGSAGSAEVGGERCDVVAVSYAGKRYDLCVAGDGRVLRESYQGKNPITRAPGQVEVTFSDYREVDGFLVPFGETQTVDGQKTLSITIESYDVNPEVDDASFAKPAPASN